MTLYTANNLPVKKTAYDKYSPLHLFSLKCKFPIELNEGADFI